MQDDILRNGSGYIDPTAYEAIKNITEDKDMKKGDIWRIQKGAKEALAVIISIREPVGAILELTEDWKYYSDVEVRTLYGGTYFVRPMCMQYCYENNFIEQVDGLTPEMFNGLQKIIAECLELPAPETEKAPKSLEVETLEALVKDLETKLKDREQYVYDLEKQVEKLEEHNETVNNKLEESVQVLEDAEASRAQSMDLLEHLLDKMTMERDIYRSEFRELQRQLMQR